MKRSVLTTRGTVTLTLVTIDLASTHRCTNVDMQAGFGSIGTYTIVTETFTPNQPQRAGLKQGGR